MTTTSHTTQPAAGISQDAVRAALSKVEDPEIHKPITELGMVKDIAA
ncbi:MAG: iron-sulfur cluster assembly protein, partial [Sciscionella sp.]